MCRCGFELKKGKGIVYSLCEFFLTHHPLRPFRVYFLAVQSLNRDFSKVLLHAEVDKFIVLDDSIVIHVIAEHILDEVVDLCFHLVEDADEKLSDLRLLELHIAIGIKLDDFFIEDLSYSEG